MTNPPIEPSPKVPAQNSSITTAGGIVLDVFDAVQHDAISSSVSKLLGQSPEPGTAKANVVYWPPRPLSNRISWNLNISTIQTILSDATKRWNVDVTNVLPYYRRVRFFLVSPTTVPFVILFAYVEIDSSKLILSETREKLRSLILPFRLLFEKLQGFSASSGTWSPRVSSISWVGLTVDQKLLDRISSDILELEKHRAEGPAAQAQEKHLRDQILQELPLTLADPAFPVLSYKIPFQNVHILIGQTDQPGIGLLRTPGLVWLTPDSDLIKLDDVFWDIRFFGSLGLGDYEMFLETHAEVTWLLALNLWATERESRSFRLDQEVALMTKSSTKDDNQPGLEKTLAKSSELGSNVALEERQVRSVMRQTRVGLNRLMEGHVRAPEIPLTLASPFITRTYRDISRTLTTLAERTRDSLEVSANSLNSVEQELSKFQRYLSDLATLRSRDVSLKLNRRLENISIILAVLTGGLVLLTAYLVWRAATGH